MQRQARVAALVGGEEQLDAVAAGVDAPGIERQAAVESEIGVLAELSFVLLLERAEMDGGDGIRAGPALSVIAVDRMMLPPSSSIVPSV